MAAENIFPTVAETLEHPAYPTTTWALEPDSEGVLPVAKHRGGPVNIAWEIHGTGPTKLVLIMGLGGVKNAWQRQTRYFGHENHEKYSVLILDNRGMGGSGKPLGRYTTSDMAKDVIELLDHVGWTGEREINLMGISLGGMIAQEIAYAIPHRLQSLSLLGTTCRFKNAKPFYASAFEVVGLLIPKTEDVTIADTARQVFPMEWLTAPDAERLPEPSTYKCKALEYRLFDSNFQRFQAQELVKRKNKEDFTTSGPLCQLAAAGLHHKSEAQLREIADKVGRERILVMHGARDGIMDAANGEKLIKFLEPSTGLIVEGMGHAPIMERAEWFNKLMEERLGVWTSL